MVVGSFMIWQKPAKAGECPKTDLGETATDCPWAGISRDLSAAATQGKPLDAILRKEAPDFYGQIHGIRRYGDWHALWGWSINFDELAHGVIVDPAILKLLYSLSAVSPPPASLGFPDNIQHAGLEHTYGYLFSVLKTDFGYKRARWVQGEIEKGFGFGGRQFSPNPAHGSLIENVTYFMGRIAFRNEPVATAVLDGHRERVDQELTAYKFGQLKIQRLEERVLLPGGRSVSIRTDLIPFPSAATGQSAGNTHLLVYSYLDSNDLGPKLITAFPVAASFVAGLNTNLGPSQSIITRYNAYIPGVTGKDGLKGFRGWTEGAPSR
jgi:hypothetical protein